MDLPNREVDTSDFNPDSIELFLELSQEVVDLASQMVLKTLLADLFMDVSIEPLHDGVLNVAHSF